MELIDCKPYVGLEVCVALSGGRDSVALLHALRVGGVSVKAVTCGHNIRTATEDEICFVTQLCERWAVPLRVFRADVPARAKTEKRGLEETARLWRYECFAQVIAEGWADVVATGHHKDDLAETVLFRLARGTSLAGLNAFPVREGIVRPLLGVTRSEIDEYVAKNRLSYVEDESNGDVGFSRNRIRHAVLPQLEQAVHGARDNLVAFAQRAAQDEEYLSERANAAVCVEGDGVRIPVGIATPLFTRAAVRAMALCGVTHDYTSANVREIARLRELQSGRRATLPEGLVAVREGEYVVFFRPQAQCEESAFAVGEFCFGARTVRVSSEQTEGALVADLDAFPPDCVLRTRREGDMFTPFGGHRKTLKKFLTDKKIPARLGKALPLVANGSEVYAVVGVEIADSVKITEKTVRRVWLSLSRGGENTKGETQGAYRL